MYSYNAFVFIAAAASKYLLVTESRNKIIHINAVNVQENWFMKLFCYSVYHGLYIIVEFRSVWSATEKRRSTKYKV